MKIDLLRQKQQQQQQRDRKEQQQQGQEDEERCAMNVEHSVLLKMEMIDLP